MVLRASRRESMHGALWTVNQGIASKATADRERRNRLTRAMGPARRPSKEVRHEIAVPQYDGPDAGCRDDGARRRARGTPGGRGDARRGHTPPGWVSGDTA